jgi:hypothetical protein
MRWVGHVALTGDMRNAYKIFVGKPEGKRPLGRPRRRWEDKIRMDLKEIGWKGVDWLHLAQDRDQGQDLLSTVLNLRIPLKGRTFLTVGVTISFSRRALLHGVSWLASLFVIGYPFC